MDDAVVTLRLTEAEACHVVRAVERYMAETPLPLKERVALHGRLAELLGQISDRAWTASFVEEVVD